MKRIIWLFLALALAAAVTLAIWRPWQDDTGGLDALTWGEVQRGDLEVVVTSTGSLEALDSVEVGTQVSGTITEIRVDFNDVVKRGDILAVIDTSLLDSALRDTQAGLERARAEYEQAEADLLARRALFDAGLLSQTEFRTFETALVSQRAAVTSAEAQVERSRQNRRNAVIVAPIDGVVIERAVEQGQTVAASFSTPRLFLLARDLKQMRILAEVDEGDIGQIRMDQEVRFQVAAQPDHDFHGKVRQLRLQPKVDQNVVKYTVVVDAANDEGLLLPGMTATLDFVVEMARDVLTVPAAATRVRPNAAMLEALGVSEGRGGRGERAEGTVRRRGPAGEAGSGLGAPGSGPANGAPGGFPADVRRIFLRAPDGKLTMRAVRLGLTDGRRIEIQPLPSRTDAADSGGAATVATPPPFEIVAGTAVVVGAPDGTSGAPGATGATGNRNAPRGFRVL